MRSFSIAFTPSTEHAAVCTTSTIFPRGAVSMISRKAGQSRRAPLAAITAHANCPAKKLDANADEGSCRNDRISPMMQGVGFDGDAVDIAAEAVHVTEPDFFRYHGDNQYT